jgi:hypothetical protein
MEKKKVRDIPRCPAGYPHYQLPKRGTADEIGAPWQRKQFLCNKKNMCVIQEGSRRYFALY